MICKSTSLTIIIPFEGKKDIFNNLQTETYLRHLMEKCADFQEEETILQTMAHQMGVEDDPSLKCHRWLTGEGIVKQMVQRFKTHSFAMDTIASVNQYTVKCKIKKGYFPFFYFLTRWRRIASTSSGATLERSRAL